MLILLDDLDSFSTEGQTCSSLLFQYTVTLVDSTDVFTSHLCLPLSYFLAKKCYKFHFSSADPSEKLCLCQVFISSWAEWNKSESNDWLINNLPATFDLSSLMWLLVASGQTLVLQSSLAPRTDLTTVQQPAWESGWKNTTAPVWSIRKARIKYWPDLGSKSMMYVSYITQDGDFTEWNCGQQLTVDCWSWGGWWTITGQDPIPLLYWCP